MQVRYAPVFAVALVLGWSAPDLRGSDFGVSAEARTKSRLVKKKAHHRVARKSAARQAAARPLPAPPQTRTATSAAAPASSSPYDLPVPPLPPIMFFPPPELQAPTRDQQMERLRTGLVRLARTMPAPEDPMEKLRIGLENLARSMSGRGSGIVAGR